MTPTGDDVRAGTVGECDAQGSTVPDDTRPRGHHHRAASSRTLTRSADPGREGNAARAGPQDQSRMRPVSHASMKCSRDGAMQRRLSVRWSQTKMSGLPSGTSA